MRSTAWCTLLTLTALPVSTPARADPGPEEGALERMIEEGRARTQAGRTRSPPVAPRPVAPSAPPPLPAIEAPAARADRLTDVYAGLSLLPGISTDLAFDGPLKEHFTVGLLMTRIDQLDGLSTAFGMTWLDRSSRGLMLAGGANVVAADLHGVGVAFAANVVTGRLEGAEIAWGVNVGDDVRGAQIGGVNRSARIDGAQVGLVNVGGVVRGTQIGLVNVADSVAGLSFGLFNFIGDGQLRLSVWSGSALDFNVGLKLGSRYFHTLFIAEIDPHGLVRGGYGGGFGGHLPFFERYWIDLDAYVATTQQNIVWNGDEDGLIGTGRLLFGVQILPQLAVFAGPALHILGTFDRRARALARAPSSASAPEAQLRVWPGLVLGVEI